MYVDMFKCKENVLPAVFLLGCSAILAPEYVHCLPNCQARGLLNIRMGLNIRL